MTDYKDYNSIFDILRQCGHGFGERSAYMLLVPSRPLHVEVWKCLGPFKLRDPTSTVKAD